MIRTVLVCDARVAFDMCPSFEPPAHVKFEEIGAWIEATLEEHGWKARDGEHFCPRHDPTMKGEIVRVGWDYVELAPGVCARWPAADREGTFPIEVKRFVPDEVRSAVEILMQQREPDGGSGRYDMVDQTQIDVLLDYISNTTEAG